MADTNDKLPEGTDTVIEGGGTGGGGGGRARSGTTMQGGNTSSATNATGGRTSVTAGDAQTDSLITGTAGGTVTGGGGSTDTSGGDGMSGESDSTSSTSSGGIKGVVSNVSTKAKDQAAERARNFVGEGLKGGSTTLGNIAGIIDDTVEQIGERLGPQYADYARSASQAINRYATTLENKNPDELVDDARDLIRKSPAVALTAAAVIGFGLVRLLKAGMPQEGTHGTRDRESDRTGSTR